MNRYRMLPICLIVCFLYTSALAIEDRIEPPSHPKKGNFSHAINPGNTFAFGQNIVTKGALDIYPTFNACKGEDFSYVAITPSIIYGLSNRCSFYVGLPIVAHQKNSDQKVQRGVENLFAQIEYALYLNNTELSQNMITIVGNVGLPTEHLSYDHCTTSTHIPTVTTFFGGMTASHISVYWYLYASLGATAFLPKNHIWQRYELLYEWGLGRVITTTRRTTIMGLLEFNGIYTARTKICDVDYGNSGGNIIYIGPSLCITSDTCYMSAGIQGPLFQSWHGTQGKQTYRLGATASVQF